MSQTPKEILSNNAGALVSRKCHSTGTIVTLYDGLEAGMDTSGPNDEVWRWQTVCVNLMEV